MSLLAHELARTTPRRRRGRSIDALDVLIPIGLAVAALAWWL